MTAGKTSMNPFRPGAGHMPPYLAGREDEKNEFQKRLKQEIILENLILTGLRGVGKTVLLDTLKPIAIKAGWLWVGTDLTEATSLTEERVVVRMLADLAVVTSSIEFQQREAMPIGFHVPPKPAPRTLTFEVMVSIYTQTPGLAIDKLKAVLEFAWNCIKRARPHVKGIIFAYDEAQNMSDKSDKNEFPLSLMLDVFQSIQKRNLPIMLVMVGLPTLFPKLVEARTFAERMFHVLFLDHLDEQASRDAILKPIEQSKCPLTLSEVWIKAIIQASGGYPYFIQFICRELFDAALQKIGADQAPIIPIPEITRKLDTDFFSGRWARATDRQRELLGVIAALDGCDGEFTAHEVVEKSKQLLNKPFTASHVSQMFVNLSEAGLIYKNRHGKYSFAVPLLGQFIRRQVEEHRL
jgi:hypothetical protein